MYTLIYKEGGKIKTQLFAGEASCHEGVKTLSQFNNLTLENMPKYRCYSHGSFWEIGSVVLGAFMLFFSMRLLVDSMKYMIDKLWYGRGVGQKDLIQMNEAISDLAETVREGFKVDRDAITENDQEIHFLRMKMVEKIRNIK